MPRLVKPRSANLCPATILCCLAGTLFLAGCNRRGAHPEVAYVSGVQANLRDRVAAVYQKTGMVKNGDRVEVLDHDRRFVKVRAPTGHRMGGATLPRRSAVYDRIQKLTADNQTDPVQAKARRKRHKSPR